MATSGTSASGLIELLQIDRAKLQNAIDKLTSSIEELKEARLTDNDPEYKIAIEENIVVIVKYKARMETLDREIEELKRGIQAGAVAMDTDLQPQKSEGEGGGGGGGTESEGVWM